MAERHQLPAPMMRRPTSLKPDKAWRQLAKERQHLRAPERPGEDNPARSINAVNLKNMVDLRSPSAGQIEANGGDRCQIG